MDVKQLIVKLKASGKLDKLIDGTNTALTLACSKGLGDQVKDLLAAGADPNAATIYGQSPLMQCIHGLRQGAWAWPEVHKAMQSLLDHGADIHHRNQIGQQVVTWASWEQDWAPMKWLLSKGASINAADDDGISLLHHAAKTGNLSAVQFLVESGANVLALAAHGNSRKKTKTALDEAKEWKDYHGTHEVVAYLMSAELAAKELVLLGGSSIAGKLGKRQVDKKAKATDDKVKGVDVRPAKIRKVRL